MIIIRLRGGLGNQMFQYAMAKRIATKFNTKLKLDLTALLKVSKNKNVTNRAYQLHIFNIEEDFLINPKTISSLYNLKLNFIVQIIKGFKFFGIKTYREKKVTVEKGIVSNPKNNVLYNGYWQSEDYFKDTETVIRDSFLFKENLSDEAVGILKKIQTTNSVCVHIRRGDYVTSDFFEPMSFDYFKKGSEYINKKVESPHFFVFSDDPEWCKDNIKFNYNFTIVDYETKRIRYKEDLQLMSYCNHFIISASSFSWWAVWLSNKKSAIVIAPKRWFLNEDIDVSDLVGKNWVRL